MTSEGTDMPSDIVGGRVRDVRERRRWTREQLAERCTAKGATGITAAVIGDIETGRKTGGKRRRLVSIEELLTLALALNVAPVHLMVPPDDPDEAYAVTPGVSADRSSVRAWIRGVNSIDYDADWREFFAEVPKDEFYAVQQGRPRRPDEPYGTDPDGDDEPR